MPSISGTCDVCSDAPSKYRCPICEVLYCSLNCYKGHKDSCKAVEHKEPNSTQNNGATRTQIQRRDKEEGELSDRENDVEEMEDEDRVKPERLQQLGESEELKGLLQNPHLRQILFHLDQSDNKETTIADAMQEPLFVEFADQALKIVEGDGTRTTENTSNQ